MKSAVPKPRAAPMARTTAIEPSCLSLFGESALELSCAASRQRSAQVEGKRNPAADRAGGEPHQRPVAEVDLG
jgi:hypothetical protein